MDVLALAKINKMQSSECVGRVSKFTTSVYNRTIETRPIESLGGVIGYIDIWNDDLLRKQMTSDKEKIVVIWDGEKWEYDVSGEHSGHLVGNMSLGNPDEPNTGEPFLIAIDADSEQTLVVTETSSKHRMQVIFLGKDYLPIANKFLPDIIAGKNGIRIVKFVSKSGKKFDLSIDDNGNLTAIETAT